MINLQEKFEDIFKPDDKQVELNGLKKQVQAVIMQAVTQHVEHKLYELYNTPELYEIVADVLQDEIHGTNDFTDDERDIIEKQFDDRAIDRMIEESLNPIYTYVQSLDIRWA